MSRTVSGPANTLLRVPSIDAEAQASLYEVLAEPDPRETNLLVISYETDPAQWLRNWQASVGESPASLAFVYVGRSAQAVGSGPGGEVSPAVRSSYESVEYVSAPSDLTGVGIRVQDVLERWGGDDRQLVIYFESLTTLLQFVERRTAYQFIHTLTGRLSHADVQSYFRMDPEAHDPQTAALMTNLMDDAVKL